MAKVKVKERPVITPLSVQAGDQLVVQGNAVKVIRAGVEVASLPLGDAVEIGSGEVASPRYLTSIFQVEVKNMPGQNVSMTGVSENATTNAVTLKFSSGNQNEYADWAAVGEVADEIDAGPEFAEKILAAKAFRASPDGANKTTQVGAQVSVNCLADEPVTYTPAE